jgi:CTP synthase
VTAGEIKTKPTQHSVKELRSIGIQPDVLICRSERPFRDSERKKIALFTNVEERAVISSPDMPSIYEIPMVLHEQKLDDIVLEKLKLTAPPAKLDEWHRVISRYCYPKNEVNIAMVGKYVNFGEAYKSLNEALLHAGIDTETRVKIQYIDAELINEDGLALLKEVDAILVPGGFGERGIEGKIKTAEYARLQQIPYLGICLGMQIAVIEYARHVADMPRANSTEFDMHTPYPVIAMVTEWQTETGARELRTADSDMGGTMRLGAQKCQLTPGSLAEKIYQQPIINERHRHRYEVNNQLLAKLEAKGMFVSGKSIDGNLVEMIELPTHPWFVACQFHPEFCSTPRDGHPLFTAFIEAALKYKAAKKSALQAQTEVKI